VGRAGAVHLALLDAASDIGVVTHEFRDARFPSVGAIHPPAIRFERAIRDLYGFEPVGLWDLRPWLDFGAWDVMQPLSEHPEEAPWTAPFVFLPVEGENLHQIPVGPVHAGNHRARPLPLHRQRRDGGPAGAAPRLRAQGDRDLDVRRDPGARRQACRPHVG
jgi:hypothetical protein